MAIPPRAKRRSTKRLAPSTCRRQKKLRRSEENGEATTSIFLLSVLYEPGTGVQDRMSFMSGRSLLSSVRVQLLGQVYDR